MFGLKESEVATLVRAVSRKEDLTRDQIEERFARATWTGIAEPGDRFAARVIDVLGPAGALAALVAEWSAEQLADAGVDGTIVQLREALARWTPRVSAPAALLAVRQASRFGARLRIPDEAD